MELGATLSSNVNCVFSTPKKYIERFLRSRDDRQSFPYPINPS